MNYHQPHKSTTSLDFIFLRENHMHVLQKYLFRGKQIKHNFSLFILFDSYVDYTLSHATNSYPMCFSNHLDLRQRKMRDKFAAVYHFLAVLLLLYLKIIVKCAFPQNRCCSVFILRKNKVRNIIVERVAGVCDCSSRSSF